MLGHLRSVVLGNFSSCKFDGLSAVNIAYSLPHATLRSTAIGIIQCLCQPLIVFDYNGYSYPLQSFVLYFKFFTHETKMFSILL